MQALINDLLAFSRVGRVGQPHARRATATRSSARVRADLGQAIEDSGAQIEAGPLPTVSGDPSLLALVFQNLIANAIKFRGEAPPVVRVSAPSATAGSGCSACADNGIGIEPEYAERIFVIFQRLHPTDAYSRGPASGWRCAARSSSTTAAGSGWTPSRRPTAPARLPLHLARRTRRSA